MIKKKPYNDSDIETVKKLLLELEQENNESTITDISEFEIELEKFGIPEELISQQLTPVVEIEDDSIELNDIQNSSILAHKKLIKNKYNVVNTIEKLENEEQFIIHEFYY